MSWARRVDMEWTRPVWWQRRKRFQPRSVCVLMRPRLSGRMWKVSRVLSAKSSAAGGGGGGGCLGLRRLVATLGLAATPDGLLAMPDGLVATPDGLLATPDGDGAGVGSDGACARAGPPRRASVSPKARARGIRLSVFATGPTVKL